MRFFAVAAALFAAVSAQYASEVCSATATVTLTVTVPAGHLPTGPASVGPSVAPYPTTGAPYPSSIAAPVGSGTGVPVPGVPAPSGTGVVPGVPAPSGTGAYTTGTPQFTGAANAMNVPAVAAGLMGLAAYLL